MKCFDLNRDLTQPPECEFAVVLADTMFARLLGLLGQRAMAPGQALLLKPCFAVHTVGMRFSLGVFFIDKKGVVVKTIARLKPNRVAVCWRATAVVETAAFANEQTEALSLAVTRTIAQTQLS
jgi:uncharacterized membrane protein (UPF0127 family)